VAYRCHGRHQPAGRLHPACRTGTHLWGRHGFHQPGDRVRTPFYPVKQLVDQLWARHQFGEQTSDYDNNSVYADKVKANPSVSDHQVVRVHPDSGERLLFVNPAFTRRILDVSEEESSATRTREARVT
jgi:hypothetical protein